MTSHAEKWGKLIEVREKSSIKFYGFNIVIADTSLVTFYKPELYSIASGLSLDGALTALVLDK